MAKNSFMELALNQARVAFEEGEVPVGCVIVKDGEVVAFGRNRNVGDLDSTAHAEIVALRRACKILGQKRLDGCDLYVTLEPCAMCAAAISLAKIRNLYFGANDEKFGAIGFFGSKNCFHRPEIYSNIAENEAKTLMQEFFKAKR